MKRLLAVAALVLSVAGIAGPALASSTPAFSLALSPARLAVTQPGQTRMLTVSNNGTKAQHIVSTVHLVDQSASCGLGTVPSFAKVKPAAFTLRPGQSRKARLTVASDVPAGENPLVVAFASQNDVQVGGNTVSGAVGAQVIVDGAGKAAAGSQPCKALAGIAVRPATPHGSSGIPWLAVWVIVLAAVALAGCGAVALRTRPRGGHHA